MPHIRATAPPDDCQMRKSAPEVTNEVAEFNWVAGI
jgi:hypothetical protein